MQEKLYFVILAPLCSETSTFKGPGAQVGATWAPKSPPKGVRAAKVASPRAAKEVRVANLAVIGPTSLAQSCKPPHLEPDPRRIGAKIYLADKSYD